MSNTRKTILVALSAAVVALGAASGAGTGTVGGAACCAITGVANIVPAMRRADSCVRAENLCEATLFIPKK